MYKVIIVEDEITVRRGIVLTIDWNALGCMVVGEASCGEEGESLILRLQPDLVVTDLKMPRMDGVEMITRLRQAGCACRFIILTAFSDFQYARSALRLGVGDYLLKPLKNGELEEAVRKLLPAPDAQTPPPPGGISIPSPTGKSQYVEAAIQYIRTHYREDISISSAAGELEISEGYLSRLFKKETSYTFTSYLIYYRLQTAMELLKDRRVRVYEAADQVGYTDTAYFSAQFKKFAGMSPSDYQNRCGSIIL
ncbi:MAG: response regulator [Eubacteriales bacterium]|nr:response regulator [Eubacteriales bacterium]